MRIATWNINSIRAREDLLLRWLDASQPDVVCLQELKVEDADFPGAALAEAGWPHQLVWGQSPYNGVAIVSRLPLDAPSRGFVSQENDDQARLVQATVGGVRVLGGYFPNGSPVGSDKFKYKLHWFKRIRRELQKTTTVDDPVVLCGDFNVAFSDLDCWDAAGADGEILYHPDERRSLANLVRLGLVDAFRHVHPSLVEYTWWDYRAGSWQKNQGYRIDHLLVTPPVLTRVEDVQVDRHTRGWERPSDHAPVVMTLRDA